jgi:hypothetical protein
MNTQVKIYLPLIINKQKEIYAARRTINIENKKIGLENTRNSFEKLIELAI